MGNCTLKRTHYCGLLREDDIGKDVVCCGWVQTKRDMGGVIFIDLVDKEGVLQVVANIELSDERTFAAFERVRTQSVLAVKGPVTRRDPETVNPKIVTGTIEIRVVEAEILSQAATLPFNPDDGQSVREELRLKYRFLDLRRPRMQRNLRVRHKVAQTIREFMDKEGFIDVETPMLTKSTPEGARDYLVPSRVHPGHFYALPQSPQLFKQLLMVGGVDKYYQIARCFRDEDLRADRQPEFTQLDLEMSFVEQEDVLELLERLFKYVVQAAAGDTLTEPFLRLTWQDAMDRYGTDKPDLRFDLPVVDLTEQLCTSGFSVFRRAIEAGGVVRAIRIPDAADMPRSDIESLTRFAIDNGAQGMAWIAWRPDGEIYSILTKFMSADDLMRVLTEVSAKPGDFVVFSADRLNVVRKVTGLLRQEIAARRQLIRNEFRFVIVTDFPMFEYNEEEKRYTAQHHPFTMPYPDDLEFLVSEPERVRSQAYDVVLNGTELGSGSIRIHDSRIQHAVFSALGFSDEEIEGRFGFMLNAFRYGTPPHGGFAFGLDRLVMLILGEQNLREVIAFPKIKDASDPLTGAPGLVDQEQLDTLFLALTGEAGLMAEMTAAGRQAPVFDLEHVARLARIQLLPSEVGAYGEAFSQLLDLASELQTVDTSGISETVSLWGTENVYQDADTKTTGLTRDELLQNAPASQNGCFFVPEVLE